MRILSLSHTNPAYDSRIQKARKVGLDAGFDYYCIGLRRDSVDAPEEMSQIKNIESFFEKYRKTSNSNIFRISFINYIWKLARNLENWLMIVFLGIRTKPRLIHANDWYVLIPALFIKLFTGARVIYDAHELESKTNGLKPNVAIVVKAIEKISWRFIDKFISVSPSIIEWYLKELGFKDSALILNSPSFNLSELEADRKNKYLQKKFNLQSEERICVYLGKLEKGRGVDLIMSTFMTNPDLGSIVFIGNGSLREKIYLTTLTAKNIYLHEVVNHENIMSVVCSANVGLCIIEPISESDIYSLPNKLFEYAFSGLNIICSNFIEMSNFVTGNNLGQAIEPDAQSLLNALMSFTYVQKSASEIEITLKDYSWKEQAQKLANIYSCLMPKK